MNVDMEHRTGAKKSVEKIARAFHDEYERQAAKNGWPTQEATRTSFDDLPEQNRSTMLFTVAALVANGDIVTPHVVAEEKRMRKAMWDDQEARIQEYADANTSQKHRIRELEAAA